MAPRSTQGEEISPRAGQGKPSPDPSLGQALAACLSRLQARHGGKNLAEFFDGREGEAVAVSTVSRWISEPRRFPAVFLPTLAELDPSFRAQALRLILARFLAPDGLLEAMGPREAAELAREQDRRFSELAFGPGGLGERYA